MKTHFLPTQYYLEVYEDNFVDDPSYSMHSSTPFGAVSVGDHFNHLSHDKWKNPPDTLTEKFVVKEVEHVFWAVDKSHNAQKVMILVEKKPYNWEA